MGTTEVDAFLRRLTQQHRVLLLGGLAVIAHGFSRATRDADVWLEPLESPAMWAAAVAKVTADSPNAHLAVLPHWTAVRTLSEIAHAADAVGMVRVLGLEYPLDIFRHPNELDLSAFDEVWGRATLKDDGVYLPDAIDLLISKQNTERNHDLADISFLESKIRLDLGARLTVATPEQAEAIFARYVDHAVCERALANPNAAVKARARALLTELAESGDWFARDILTRE